MGRGPAVIAPPLSRPSPAGTLSFATRAATWTSRWRCPLAWPASMTSSRYRALYVVLLCAAAHFWVGWGGGGEWRRGTESEVVRLCIVVMREGFSGLAALLLPRGGMCARPTTQVCCFPSWHACRRLQHWLCTCTLQAYYAYVWLGSVAVVARCGVSQPVLALPLQAVSLLLMVYADVAHFVHGNPRLLGRLLCCALHPGGLLGCASWHACA